MSNPNPALQTRQKLHQRQNSTPVAFEGMKMHNLHPTPRQNAHRRGQSLDQSRSPIRRQNHQAGSMVSIANIGSTQQGQQILREAQQQKLARPGQRNESPTTPQCGLFPLNTQFNPDAMYNTNNTTTMNAMTQDPADMQIPHSPFYAQEMNMPMSAGFDGMGFGLDENSQHYFQPLHHPRQDFGNGMIDARRMSQPDLQLYTEQRPITPAQRINTGKYQMTETNLRILTCDRTMASDASYYTVQADHSSFGIFEVSPVFTNETTCRPNDPSTLPDFHAARPIVRGDLRKQGI